MADLHDPARLAQLGLLDPKSIPIMCAAKIFEISVEKVL